MAQRDPDVYDPAVGFVVLEELLMDPLRSEVIECCAGLVALPEAERHIRDKVASGTHHLNDGPSLRRRNRLSMTIGP